MSELTAGPVLLNEIEDVMVRLRLGRSSVFGLIATGELRSVKVGRRRLIPESALIAYVANLESRSGT